MISTLHKSRNKSKSKTKLITKAREDKRTLAWRKKTTYTIWYNMVARCTDSRHPAYNDYGGRGIKVHPLWCPSSSVTAAEAFINFVADVGLRPSSKLSLDRKNPNGNYEPSNVAWATLQQQARNKRESVFLPDPEDPSKLIPAAELAQRLGLRYQTLRYRLQRRNAWPPDMVPFASPTTLATATKDEENNL